MKQPYYEDEQAENHVLRHKIDTKEKKAKKKSIRKGDDDLSIGSYFYAELCSRTLLKVKSEKQDSEC